MTQPPYGPNQPDPTRPFNPPPQQYPSGQAVPPPVVGGPPSYPQPGPAYGPPTGQPYGFQPPQPPKRASGLKVVGIIVGGVLGLCVIGGVAAAVAGGDDKPKATARPATAAKATQATQGPAEVQPAEEPAADDSDANFNVAPGTTMTLTSDDSVQEVTVKAAKLHKGACGGFGAKPENGSYLVAEVLVVQKKGVGSVNPLFFTFVGDDGTSSNSIGGAFSGCTKNDLDSTNSLRAGSKRSGQIAFDVKNGKGAIELAPGLASDTLGSWKVG